LVEVKSICPGDKLRINRRIEMTITNQLVIDKIDIIEKKLPNGELQKIMDDTKEIRDCLVREKKS